MAKSPQWEILTDNGSTSQYTCEGTIVQIMLEGDLDGGSVAVELISPRGAWVPLCDDSNTPIALTVEQVKNVEVPAQSGIRCTLAGSTSPDLGIKIAELSDGRQQY